MGNDFDATWPAVAPKLIALTVAAQLAAARLAEPYLADVLAQTNQPDAPVAVVRARGFVGTATDGRPLPTFLYGAVIAAKRAQTRVPTIEALAVGARWLSTATLTVVADTTRTAVATGITVRPEIDGYVRETGGAACDRCEELAGEFYRYDASFQRHPQCGCYSIPSTFERASDLIEPSTTVASADLSSLSVAAVTLEGRRMPEQIISATPDRMQAIDLLRRAGFVA